MNPTNAAGDTTRPPGQAEPPFDYAPDADGAGDAPAATRLDLAFPLRASGLPREHQGALADALAAVLPWLGREPGTGMHRLKVVAGNQPVVLLSGRTRLLLRVPRERADEATAALAGRVLDVAGAQLSLGSPTARELRPWGTLYAHFVVAGDAADELAFLTAMAAELRALGVACRPICGRHQTLAGAAGSLGGYSLMLDRLTPSGALRVLEHGLGAQRRLGCGLFVPHKSAAAVGA